MTNGFEEWKIVDCLLSCLFEICGHIVYALKKSRNSHGYYKPRVNDNKV